MRRIPLSLFVLAPLVVAATSTAQTCRLVKDINPGLGQPPAQLTDCFGQFLLFWGDDGTHGHELWKSDGTAAGTVLLKDIRPGIASSSRYGEEKIACAWTVEGLRAFFVLRGEQGGQELWKTDGTTAGTVMVKDYNMAGPPYAANGRVFFYGFAAGDPTGSEAWVSDGTTAGTLRLSDLPGLRLGSCGPLFTFRGRVVYAAFDGDALAALHSEPYVTDGTVAGTRRLKDIIPGALGSFPLGGARLGDAAFFLAGIDRMSGTRGRGLWKTDGSEVGTVLVKDPNPDTMAAAQVGAELVACNDRLFFVASDGAAGRELWISDGTTTGTFMLIDLNPGADSSLPRYLTCADDRLFFAAYDGSGVRLWVSDGTVAGTLPVGPDPSFDVDPIRNVGGRVYFTAQSAATGAELWVSDGTVAGTHEVCDLWPGPDGSTPRDFQLFRGDLYFVARDSSTSYGDLYVLELPGANYRRLGEGSAGTFSILDATSPVLGGVATHTYTDGPAGHIGLVFLDMQRAPFTMPGVFVSGACAVVDNLSAAAIPLGTVQPPQGSFGLRIPNVPEFEGAEVHTQIWWANLQSVLPIATSNGVQLSVGR